MENEKIEKYTEKQPENISDLFPEILDYIYNLCLDNNYDPDNIKPMNFKFILLQVRDNYIRPNKRLLQTPYETNNGGTAWKYNPDSIILLYEFYLSISYKYNQPITLKAFLYLSGINNSTIYGSKIGELLNSHGIDFNKKLKEDSENSFLDYGLSNKAGSVVALATLNHRFGWNDSKPAANIQEPETMSLNELENSFNLFLTDSKN